MVKVAGMVDWGIEVVQRTDLFGEEWQDAIIRFGRQHRGEYLSETNRHWLCWLFCVKRDEWPAELLNLVWYWGNQESAGKDETFDDLIDAMRLSMKEV